MSTHDARPASDPDPDEELVRRMASGDQGACAGLLERHLSRIHALAQRLLGNAADADEVSQDVFLRAWQQASKWQPGRARYSTWLYRVALNVCRDRLRAQHPQSDHDVDQLPDFAPSPERLADSRQIAVCLDSALRRLPPRQREALVLFHDHDMSQSEIAASLELSIEAVESLLARARRALRSALQDSMT